MSPSHDLYVRKKLQSNDAIDGTRRLAMVAAGLSQSSWLRPSGWELSQSGFIDFPDVVRWHQNYIRSKCDARIFYVCGSDQAVRTNLHLRGIGDWCDGIVIVSRKGPEWAQLQQQRDKLSKNIYLVDTNPESDCSSTAIRKLLKENASISGIVPDPVLKLISSYRKSSLRGQTRSLL